MIASKGKKQRLVFSALLMVVFTATVLVPGTAPAFEKHWRRAKAPCKTTTLAAFNSCQFEIKEEYWMTVGKCSNLSDPEAAAECLEAAKEEKKEARQTCREQLEARLQVCSDLGPGPYDPDLAPDDFVDPEAITVANANPYLPLLVGTRWVYEGDTEDGLETITVTVTDEIKEIEYPEESGQVFACVVVRDVVELDGEVIEDTFDWYAQDNAGNVWYFGELSKNFEDGELVDIEGSWKAGVEGAIPGISMPAAPQVGSVYRQEYALGDAEDMATVVSLGQESVAVPYGEFSDAVLKIGEYTPIEPDAYEYKYYAPGVGMVLEVNPESGERVELIEMGAD